MTALLTTAQAAVLQALVDGRTIDRSLQSPAVAECIAAGYVIEEEGVLVLTLSGIDELRPLQMQVSTGEVLLKAHADAFALEHRAAARHGV